MENHNDPDKLFVSIIIVARNAEECFGNLVNDYLQQDYPASLRELIFVDGASEDATKTIIQEFSQAHPELSITILDNPKRIQAPALNLALRATRGDIVCRVDAHVSIPRNYISNGVRLLLEKKKDKVACVGGPWQTVGKGFWGQAIAKVLSTPFGVGNAKFRYSQTAQFVDTVPCGFYWKWVFDEVGSYREDLVRSEDNELHARILARGWKFFLYPGLMTKYQCRSEVVDFLRQAFGNGYWSMITWRQSSWRHLVPFCFMTSLMVLGFFSILWEPCRYLLLALLSVYGLSSILVSLAAAFKSEEWPFVFVLPILFFLLHLTYGMGSVCALIFFNRRWMFKEVKVRKSIPLER
ncbi:MAG: glycosyltransferase family 2 protein [Deltaproteobacteria bacterium]|nr:glycosyltransferase family 2 protein [Deltaproteobacteria bacterium]